MLLIKFFVEYVTHLLFEFYDVFLGITMGYALRETMQLWLTSTKYINTDEKFYFYDNEIELYSHNIAKTKTEQINTF